MSLGTIPSVHITMKAENKNLRGLVLVSPLSPYTRLVEKGKISPIAIDMGVLSDAAIPIFVIHGKEDEIIPCKFSEDLVQKLRNKTEWFPKGTHSNIITKFRFKFFIKMKYFLEHLNYCSNKKESQLTNSTDYSKVSMKLKNIYTENNYMGNSPRLFQHSPINSKIKLI